MVVKGLRSTVEAYRCVHKMIPYTRSYSAQTHVCSHFAYPSPPPPPPPPPPGFPWCLSIPPHRRRRHIGRPPQPRPPLAPRPLLGRAHAPLRPPLTPLCRGRPWITVIDGGDRYVNRLLRGVNRMLKVFILGGCCRFAQHELTHLLLFLLCLLFLLSLSSPLSGGRRPVASNQ